MHLSVPVSVFQSLMTVERMERLFQSQRQWEKSAFGAICQQNRDMAEVDGMFENQQFMMQYFLGVLGIGVLPKLGERSRLECMKSEEVKNTVLALRH